MKVRLVSVLLLAAAAVFPAAAGADGRRQDPGFLTSTPAMLTPLAPGSSVKPIISVGDTVGSYMFESIPDGIALKEGRRHTVDVWVNHELSLVPFPATRSDFSNSLVSHLRLNEKTAGVLAGEYDIPSSANYQRFCSSFLVGREHGFKREILFTNEEARDLVYRTGTAWPLMEPADPRTPEQAGVVVALDIESGRYRSIYGMGRHNHENSVAIPGYKRPVLLSGDDTFDAPASQLYLYTARSGSEVLRDRGSLYAFVSDNPAVNDYGDLTPGGSVSGRFIPVPRMIATGKRADGTDVNAADFGYPAPTNPAIPNGPQWVLEHWSNLNNVFQFIRVEDIAYDRKHENVVYLADTGEPRALPDPATGRLMRGPSTARGAYPNGRIFQLVLDRKDPLRVRSFSILIDGDEAGYGSPMTLHQPDNLETTKRSLLVQEDPGGHNQGTPAKIWRYDLRTGSFTQVAAVNQSLRPDLPVGSWESSGIVDASDAFGRGSFLVDVQASGYEIAEAPSPVPGVFFRRAAGQLLLFRLPDA